MSNNEFSDHAVAAVDQFNPVFNMRAPQIAESILKNQEQLAKLIETQSKLIESLLKYQ